MEPQTYSIKRGVGVVIGILGIILTVTVSILGARKPAEVSAPIVTTDTLTPIQPSPVPVFVPTSQQTNDIPVTTTPSPTTPPVADIPTQVNTAPVISSIYKDGTYSATGSYMSPGGVDQLGVSLTLSNDVITDVSVTPEAQDNTSLRYENIFAANYKQYVVGKDISTVYFNKVSGSSLTPTGFNNALSQIEAQAKA